MNFTQFFFFLLSNLFITFYVWILCFLYQPGIFVHLLFYCTPNKYNVLYRCILYKTAAAAAQQHKKLYNDYLNSNKIESWMTISHNSRPINYNTIYINLKYICTLHIYFDPKSYAKCITIGCSKYTLYVGGI